MWISKWLRHHPKLKWSPCHVPATSGHQAIGPGKAVDTSGLEGIGCRCVADTIGCLIGGSSIGDRAGHTGTSSPGTGNVSIGIAATDTLTAPGGHFYYHSPFQRVVGFSAAIRTETRRPHYALAALLETTCYTGAVHFQGENTNVMTGAHHA